MDDDTKTITWMDACGRIASLTVPADVAEKIANGDRVSWYGDQEPTRQTKDEALKQIRDERAGLLARKDRSRPSAMHLSTATQS